MIYGYARCSTNELQQDIDRQRRELNNLGVDDDKIYCEYMSGTKVDRPEWQKLLNAVKEGDTILATEVSRITRSTKQLCDIIELSKKKRLRLVLGTLVVDCTKSLDPMTEGMLKMMGVFAELERNMTSERVKSGLQNAVAKGKALGRPVTSQDTIPPVFYRYYPKYKNREITKKEYARLCEVSYPTVYKYLKIIEGELEEE
mgnify:FL=1